MKLSIVIVSWNVADKLRNNLTALFASKADFAYEVFVVDNNSSDHTADIVTKDFPQVKLIANKENFGFAKASNQGLKQATGDYLLLLNPDMKVFPTTLSDLVAWLDANPQADVAGGKLVDETGKIIFHVRNFPKLSDQLAVVLKLPHLFPAILNKYLRKDFDYEKAAKVDSIRGSFFAIRRSALDQIGLLDERFFVWFEEVDYCRRVAEAGGEVWYTPSAVCLDYVGQSFSQIPKLKTQKIFKDSQLKYFAKWHSGFSVALLGASWIIGLWLTKIFLFLKIKTTNRT
jgi:GT2 family glycosyltransferase